MGRLLDRRRQREGIRALANDGNGQLIGVDPDLLFETRTDELSYDFQRRLPTAASFLHERRLSVRIISNNSCAAQELPRLPPGSVPGLQQASADQPINCQHAFGNIVTAVYSAILREISTKGMDARFTKTERGKFAISKAS